MFLAEFITIAVIHFLAVMSPGPDFAMTVKNSLSYGRKAGIYTGIGMGLGIGVHVLYSLVGIGFIISQSIVLFNVIKFMGAMYLIYIGIHALQSKPAQVQEIVSTEEGNMASCKAMQTGFLTNVLNPKATLFFLGLFTQVINPETPLFVQALYGTEMMVATALWFTVVAVFFSHRVLRVKIVSVKHYFERFLGVVLVALGIKVATSVKE